MDKGQVVEEFKALVIEDKLDALKEIYEDVCAYALDACFRVPSIIRGHVIGRSKKIWYGLRNPEKVQMRYTELIDICRRVSKELEKPIYKDDALVEDEEDDEYEEIR